MTWPIPSTRSSPTPFPSRSFPFPRLAAFLRAHRVSCRAVWCFAHSAFMSKFYKMYPESQARLEVYERRGRQCSFAVPLERGHLGGPHRAIIRSGGRYEQMIRGWLGQPAPPPTTTAFMDSTQPELSVLPTTVTKQFARFALALPTRSIKWR